jgi:hypothetical protein
LNNACTPVDLTEASLEELCDQIRDMRFRIQPTRYIVPVWALEEIIAEYGTATEENYFRWLARRRA